jgi:hypothetical protein
MGINELITNVKASVPGAVAWFTGPFPAAGIGIHYETLLKRLSMNEGSSVAPNESSRLTLNSTVALVIMGC